MDVEFMKLVTTLTVFQGLLLATVGLVGIPAIHTAKTTGGRIAGGALLSAGAFGFSNFLGQLLTMQ